MDWIRKKCWKNHWGILDFENLQSRSHFIFCISESWIWLSSVIDALKMGKQWKKTSKHLWPLNRDFQGQGCLQEFFLLFFTYLAHEITLKYPLKPSWQMRQIFYIALYVACGAGRYIDQKLGLGLCLRYPVILCRNFAFIGYRFVLKFLRS